MTMTISIRELASQIVISMTMSMLMAKTFSMVMSMAMTMTMSIREPAPQMSMSIREPASQMSMTIRGPAWGTKGEAPSQMSMTKSMMKHGRSPTKMTNYYPHYQMIPIVIVMREFDQRAINIQIYLIKPNKEINSAHNVDVGGGK